MKAAITGQVTNTAAEIYEQFFVPCLFAEWAPRVVAAAGVRPGDRVLDVACGTGVLARAAARTVGPEGAVVGLDLNPGMLDVARKVAPAGPPAIEWREGRAEALPFDDASFDRVVCQFGIMFFEDRAGALAEMWRVLKPGGRLAVAVWGNLEATPGYLAMTHLLERLFGAEIASALRVPYNLGDAATLEGLFASAGIPGAEAETYQGLARFPSIDAWVHVDVRGWSLADSIDDAQYEKLVAAANAELARLAGPDGTVTFPHGAHIVTAQKPA